MPAPLRVVTMDGDGGGVAPEDGNMHVVTKLGDGDGGGLSSLAEKAMALLAVVLAKKPLVLMIAWEAGGLIESEAVPDSRAVLRGLVSEVAASLEDSE